MTRMPDFIIIGAMKCATSTLHDQLAAQPGIFMSTPKEPNFFSDDAQWGRGIGWYESLFAAAATVPLAGESSTHYSKWPTHPCTIERMKQHLPEHVKFIYIMRHPIDRLVSQYIHEWTQREITCPIDDAIDRHSELIAYSQYASQLQHYIDEFGTQRILPMFFERLATHSQEELERVCRFIGYESTPRWNDAIGEQNVSNQRLRKSPIRDAIIDLPGLKMARRTLVPKAAREWVKGLWQMKQRPMLSEANRMRVERIFDHDLKALGRWLGVDLSCKNFKSIAVDANPTWQVCGKVAA